MGRKLISIIGTLTLALGVSGIAYAAAALEVQAEPELVEIGGSGVTYHVTVTYNGVPVSSGVTFTVTQIAWPYGQCNASLSTPTAVTGQSGRYIASATPQAGNPTGCVAFFKPGRTILRIQATYQQYRGERLMTIDPVFGIYGSFGVSSGGGGSF